MDRRRILTALALALVAMPPMALGADPVVTWAEAACLKPDRPPRPKPIEPDAPNNGPFRVDPAHTIDRPDPVPLPPPRVQAPQVYQLADAWGQTWTHTDPAWLQQWVGQRNASAVRYQYGGTVCGPGGCPPRR